MCTVDIYKAYELVNKHLRSDQPKKLAAVTPMAPVIDVDEVAALQRKIFQWENQNFLRQGGSQQSNYRPNTNRRNQAPGNNPSRSKVTCIYCKILRHEQEDCQCLDLGTEQITIFLESFI